VREATPSPIVPVPVSNVNDEKHDEDGMSDLEREQAKLKAEIAECMIKKGT
jgi:hypothetical protein